MAKSAKPVFSNISLPVAALFIWYDRHGRHLPWRSRWPELAPAYHVWLSEIMLQQTVVATVIPYFLEFTRRWPDVHALAAAPLDDVLAAWAGLGYYARARNLHKTACIVANDLGGAFPDHANQALGLRDLPGVGPYTAGAIAAIAFGQQAIVVDGNIERLFSRYFGIETPLPAAKIDISAAYEAILPVARPSDFPQALMDFANAVCTVKQPGCAGCPFAGSCVAVARDMVTVLPVKPVRKAKPTRRATLFIAMNEHGEVYLLRRPDKGLLGGMQGFPETGLGEKNIGDICINDAAPFDADWAVLDEPVQHVFTHFLLSADLAIAHVQSDKFTASNLAGRWQVLNPGDLPSLMRKAWKLAASELASS